MFIGHRVGGDCEKSGPFKAALTLAQRVEAAPKAPAIQGVDETKHFNT
jgi:hypothetical protein